jgi:hypothetical protein
MDDWSSTPTLVIYTYDEDKDELEAKARAAVIPIVTNTPGYISYGVVFDDDHVCRRARGSPKSTPKWQTQPSWSG